MNNLLDASNMTATSSQGMNLEDALHQIALEVSSLTGSALLVDWSALVSTQPAGDDAALKNFVTLVSFYTKCYFALAVVDSSYKVKRIVEPFTPTDVPFMDTIKNYPVTKDTLPPFRFISLLIEHSKNNKYAFVIFTSTATKFERIFLHNGDYDNVKHAEIKSKLIHNG